MADILTMIADMIDPEVMADMIDGKLDSKIIVSQFAKVDTKKEPKFKLKLFHRFVLANIILT